MKFKWRVRPCQALPAERAPGHSGIYIWENTQRANNRTQSVPDGERQRSTTGKRLGDVGCQTSKFFLPLIPGSRLSGAAGFDLAAAGRARASGHACRVRNAPGRRDSHSACPGGSGLGPLLPSRRQSGVEALRVPGQFTLSSCRFTVSPSVSLMWDGWGFLVVWGPLCSQMPYTRGNPQNTGIIFWTAGPLQHRPPPLGACSRTPPASVHPLAWV